jgi:hypothetical protein
MSSINPIKEYQSPFSIEQVKNAIFNAFQVSCLRKIIEEQTKRNIPDDPEIGKFDAIAQMYGAFRIIFQNSSRNSSLMDVVHSFDN